MKLLVVTTSFAPQISGVSVAAAERCRALAERGHEVVLVIPSCFGADAAIPGVRVRTFPAVFVKSTSSTLSLPFAGEAALRAAVRELRPDRVFYEEPERLRPIAWPLPRALRNAPAEEALPARVPSIGMLHTFYEAHWRQEHDEDGRVFRAFARSLYARAQGVDRLITHCTALAEVAGRHGLPRPLVGRFHGIAELFFAGTPPRLADREGDVLFVGQLRRTKRIFEWLQVVKLLQQRRPGLTASVAGGGEHAQLFAAEAQSLGVRLRLLGPLAPASVRAELDRHRVFLNLSDTEGFCTANLEAGARGLVLALAAGGGNVDQVEEGRDGRLFAPGDLQAAAAAVDAALDDPERAQAMADAARARASRYRWSEVARELEPVLLSAGE